jgi:hypothetical protein
VRFNDSSKALKLSVKGFSNFDQVALACFQSCRMIYWRADNFTSWFRTKILNIARSVIFHLSRIFHKCNFTTVNFINEFKVNNQVANWIAKFRIHLD